MPLTHIRLVEDGRNLNSLTTGTPQYTKAASPAGKVLIKNITLHNRSVAAMTVGVYLIPDNSGSAQAPTTSHVGRILFATLPGSDTVILEPTFPWSLIDTGESIWVYAPVPDAIGIRIEGMQES